MNSVLKISPGMGHQSVLRPGQDGVQWLGLDVLRLAAGQSWATELAGEEAVLVIFSGRCGVSVAGKKSLAQEHLGERADIFAGPPSAAYVPINSRLEVTAQQPLEAAIVRAPCQIDLPPRVIAPKDVKVVSAGSANWQRDVRLIIGPDSAISGRLILGETFNPPGNWSGMPPHKHDQVSDAENALEEFYLFKTAPANGYAVQLMYDDDAEQAHVVGNDDVAFMAKGYHPTVAAPGTTVVYLWALSGQSRDYKIVSDPRFESLNRP